MAATYLSEDMLIEILSKLPHKSLVHFRGVSKSWFSLIGTPDLVSKKLLNNSLLNPSPTTTQNSHLIIERTVLSPAPKQICSSDETKEIYSFLSYNTLDLDDNISQIPLNLPPPRLWWQRTDLKIVGSCNGLVCITREDDIFLWNPATSALKKLPYSTFFYNACFGFDAKSKDFKVMRNYHTEYPYSPNDDEDDCDVLEVILEAEVYRLSSGCWRKFNIGDMPVSMWSDSLKGVRAYANGVCFWMDGIENIVAFDVTQEAFKMTRLPDACTIRYPNETYREIAVLDESLALIISSQRNKEKWFDIWVLSEVGIMESWNRHMTIRTPFLDLERPLGFWNNSELFMENTKGQLVLFNPFTQIVKSLQVDGIKKSLQLFHYTPTLFPIDSA